MSILPRGSPFTVMSMKHNFLASTENSVHGLQRRSEYFALIDKGYLTWHSLHTLAHSRAFIILVLLALLPLPPIEVVVQASLCQHLLRGALRLT